MWFLYVGWVMFIGNRYYNEENISTIDYSIVASYENFEIRSLYSAEEAKEEDWIYNKTKHIMSQFKEKGWGGNRFSLQTDDEVKNLKDKAKQQRQKIDEETRRQNENSRSYNGFGLSEHDVQQTERNAEVAERDLSKQKMILGRKVKHEYVFHQGNIIPHVNEYW